jgi:SecD/SecF fusion protein
MNKKPVLLRIIIALGIIAVFASSIYPLKPLNFYNTFMKFAVDKDAKLEKTITLAKEIEAKQKDFPSVAIEKASRKLGTDLTKYVKVKGSTGNRDVIAFIKQQAASSIRLGLDLNGGVEFILKVVPDNKIEDNEGNKVEISLDKQRETAIEVLRNRLESENIFEAEISPVGSDYVSLKVPTVSKDEINAIRDMLTMSARLEFKLLNKDNNSLVSKYFANPETFIAPDGYEVMQKQSSGKDGEVSQTVCIVKKRPEMRGRGNIAEAAVRMDQFGQRYISLTFTLSGAKKFGTLTSKHVGDRLAIVLDGMLYSAPVLNSAITGGRAQIEGDFSQEEAGRIAKALMSGNLPKMQVEALFETDPTLGAESVQKGAWAGIYGLLAVIIFMIIYYRRAGVIADVALLINIVMIMGFMATFGATLTLPGLAGIVLTIGMAVDANVLIFERIREELDKGKNLLTSIDVGYSRAFVTIFDSNITTLFVGLILMWQGSGPIKGFAVTLSIGIATSMFTALFVTRLMFDVMHRMLRFETMKMMRFFSKPNIDFLGMKSKAFTISAALILIALIAAAVINISALGIDFTGGTRLTFDYKPDAQPNQVELTKLLVDAGYDAKVSYKTNLMQDKDIKKLEIVIRKQKAGKEKNDNLKAFVQNLVNKKFPNAKIENGSETSLGALIGLQFAQSALIAIIFAVIGIIIYISARFEFAFAIASIIALLHDITIATGLFIIFGYFFPSLGSGEISLPVIAALLTIMGYSLNDTIVVFDRIRENLSLIEGKSYKEIINASINQTLSRTVLTSLTTLLVLIVLFASGVVAINDFVLVMIIGIVVGTYSSIFIASPIIAVWHKKIGVKLKED